MRAKSKKSAKATVKTIAAKNSDGIIVPKILPPKVDIVFKMLFGDKRNIDTLKEFLKAVLHLSDKELKNVALTDTHLKKETIDDKLSILDVRAELASGKILDIEIQVKNIPEMRNRITLYNAKMITSQIGGGGKYADIKPAISIVIADFPLVPESKKCHTAFQMLEKGEHFPFNDLQEINILDLTKIGNEKDKKLSNWLKFLTAKDEEDFMAVAKKEPAIGRAYTQLKHISADKKRRDLYENRLKGQRDLWSIEDAAIAKGKAEGRTEGRAEILDLIRQGFSASEIEKRFAVG